MTKHKGILILLLLAAILLISTAGSYGVIETSDARYAEIGREMFLSGDWLHPNLLDVHHYHKPPVTYQITALGYTLFGVNSFGARFFLQVAILLQILLVYLLTLEFTDKRRTALWASAVYFTFPLVLIASRNLTTDAFLTLFTLLSIYAWVRYRKGGEYRWLYLFTFSLGLGFLTKGPVVFLAPAIFTLFYNRLETAKHAWSRHHLLAWGLFLALASSWFIYLAVDNPAFWDYFIGRQTVDRFSHNVFNRSEPFWYFIVLAPLLGMPWLFLLPWFVRKLHIQFTAKTIEGVLLLTVLVPLVFFSLSTSKRILYILPLYPLFAVMVALMLEKIPEEKSPVVLRTIGGYALLLFSILAIAPWIPGKIAFPAFFTPVSLLLILLTVWFWRSSLTDDRNKSVLLSFVTAAWFLLAATVLFSYSAQSFKIARPATEWIKAHHLDDREVLVYNKRLPSVAFELNRSTVSLYDGERLLNREVQFEKDATWKQYLYNLQEKREQERLKRLLQSRPTLLITYKGDLPKGRGWLRDHYKHREEVGKWTIYY